MKNYFNQLMLDGYNMLSAEDIDWPKDISYTQRMELLQTTIEYFQELEDYEKCVNLKSKIDQLINAD
jgi:hypothetical protein